MKLNNILRNLVILDADEGIQAAWAIFFTEWKSFIAFIAGAAALTSVLVFIFLLVRLGKSGDNPYERSIILREMTIALIIAALLGGSSLVLALFVEVVAMPT